MLILTRKRGEGIAIGNDIRISILEIHGKSIRLGINAPKHVPVHREEIYLKVQEQNRKAASESMKADFTSLAQSMQLQSPKK